MLALVLAVPVLLATAPASGTAAEPETPRGAPVGGDPWVVSLGDSYISGEGGRWAGNTDESSDRVDALGPTAYFDNPTDTGELIPGCHRSKSAEVHIGGAYQSKNLACSGAQTETFTESNGNFKPGLDFYDVDGDQGQALMLQEFATTNRVTHIAVSIGGNNFGFAPTVETCVEDFALSTPLDDFYCSQDATVTDRFSPQSAAARKAEIVTGLQNVRQAMRNAGYTDGSYSVSVQNYVTPIPYGTDFRYPESGYSRITDGGCGFWDVDANWSLNEAMRVVNTTSFEAALASGLENLVLVDVSGLTSDRLLCQDGVELLPDGVVSDWQFPGAVDVSEWINQVRTASTITGPYQLQESLHPNYWAQLALRNCLRQVVGDGTPTGGSCVRSGGGLDADGEPPVALQPSPIPLRPTAVADDVSTVLGTTLNVAAPGVLDNDVAAEASDVLVSTLVGVAAHGTVTLLADGSFEYVPGAGFSGTDTFTYRAADADATSEVVTVTVVVAGVSSPNPAPSPVAPRFTG